MALKKRKFNIKDYIPLLIAVITLMGTIIGGVLTIISNSRGIESDIKWIKEEMKELKQSISKTDSISSDNFSEIMGMLEKMNNEDKKRK